MHAYAADDPVFVALETLGQEDTGGALGTFCMSCHAPTAVSTGAAGTAAELADLGREYRGVTCYGCHQIDAVEGDSNGALHYAADGVFRGPIADFVATPAHGQRYDERHDGATLSSSAACGACHDVKLANGAHLERTFAEWKDSLFGQPGPGALSCGACHMPSAEGRAAAVPDAPVRRVHDHSMPGIDVALTDWPETEAQRAGIDRDLRAAVLTGLCVTPGEAGLSIDVTLDNVLVGHAWPSGVTHARRAWVEVIAWQGAEQVYQSGQFADGEPVSREQDPDLWLLGTELHDADGNPVHEPWRAAEVAGELLPFAVTADPSDPRYFHAVTRSYAVAGTADRVTLRLFIQPVGLDILDWLIADGRLDPAVRERMPTLEVTQGAKEWRLADGYGCAR